MPVSLRRFRYTVKGCLMRESCSCGAAIHVFGYKRAQDWRATHRHDGNDLVELDTNTDFPIGFRLEADEECD